MKPPNPARRAFFMLSACFWAAGLGAAEARAETIAAAAAPAQGRAWTVEDSIGIRYFVEATGTSWWGLGELPPSASPDGRYFFIMSARGDLTCDCQRFELAIYATSAVRAALGARGGERFVGPERVVRMRTPDRLSSLAITNGPVWNPVDAIDWPQWQGDSTLLLRGTGDGESYRGVYSYAVPTGELRRLTPQGRDISDYDVHAGVRAGAVLYNSYETRAIPREANGVLSGLEYPVHPIGGLDFSRLSNGWTGWGGIFLSRPDGTELTLDPFRPADRKVPPFSPIFSPDGEFAAVPIPVDRARFELLAARDPEFSDAVYDDLTDPDRRRLWQFGIVDTRTGGVATPVDRLLGAQPQRLGGGYGFARAFWLGGGQRLLMVNVVSPFVGRGADLRSSSAVLSYDPRSRTVSTAVSPPGDGRVLVSAAPVHDGQAVQLGYRGLDGGRSFVLVTWDAVGLHQETISSPVDQSRPLQPPLQGFTLALKQGPTTAPIAVARREGREVALTPQDTAVRGLAMSEEQPFEWRDSHGHSVIGRLVLPSHRPTSGRFPLVLQFEGIDSRMNLFRPDGTASTGMAAQALAARGIMVLRLNSQADRDHPAAASERVPQREGMLMMDRVETAIQTLERRGLVDPARVGMIGFSRTGFHVNYFITHSRFVPAAAIIQDATSRGYFELITANASENRQYPAPGYGFWTEKERWLGTAPGFNYDAVDTPALFTYNGAGFAMSQLAEPLAGFRMNNREAYFQIFPEAGHQMQRPRQRLASMQTTVDWFSFWLLGQENGDPRSLRNRRWRQLRAHRDTRWAAARAVSRPFDPGWRELTPQAARAAMAPVPVPQASAPEED